MEDSRSEIIAGIRELRAKAAEQLTGNTYYMIVQQLNSLENNTELNGDLARSVLSLIEARIDSEGTLVAATGGDPEVPNTPDSPAEPSTPSTPEEPSVPDSPAQPSPSPMPDIPSPPGSPSEPSTPPEIPTQGQQAEGDVDHIITPRANSFGMPQPTVAISLTSIETADATSPAQAYAKPPVVKHPAPAYVERPDDDESGGVTSEPAARAQDRLCVGHRRRHVPRPADLQRQ